MRFARSKAALKIANSILGSIGKVIPPAGAVEEFKQILEGSLDLGDGRGPLKKLGSWGAVKERGTKCQVEALSSVSAGVSVPVRAHRVVCSGDHAVQFAGQVGGLLVQSA